MKKAFLLIVILGAFANLAQASTMEPNHYMQKQAKHKLHKHKLAHNPSLCQAYHEGDENRFSSDQMKKFALDCHVLYEKISNFGRMKETANSTRIANLVTKWMNLEQVKQAKEETASRAAIRTETSIRTAGAE